MVEKPLRTAVSVYLALGVAGGLLLSGYVFWVEFHDALVRGAPNEAFCIPVPGDGGDIPIADSVYSCRIAGEYLLMTLVYPPTIVTFWTSLCAALLAGAAMLWRALGRLFGVTSGFAETTVPPTRLAMSIYGISVLCLGMAGQISDGWYLLGPFALVTWPALLAPLPLFAAVRYLWRRFRDASAISG
ncbi:MAG: hypothetical protein R3268_11015 [Acidiferrobacterales bacterium]|nr:hypothetical protein [Acidiferrobacterales bacterium]